MGLDVAVVLPVLVITGWWSPILWGLLIAAQVWTMIHVSWSYARLW